MNHLLVAVACLALAACSKSKEAAAPPAPSVAAPVAWPDARTLKLAVTSPSPDRTERLELRHLPGAGPDLAHLQLVLLMPEGEQVLVDEKVPLARRDQAWAGRYLLMPEPLPGVRRAVSWDGGATYAVILPLSPGRFWFCPHKKVEGVNNTPDWPKMLTHERWATGVLETAVWGCDEAGLHCKSRSQAGMTVHHSDPETDPLVVTHESELHAVLAILETLKVDRFMAPALLDAAVSVQRGLDATELEKLGQHAAAALGPKSPMSEDERKAMRLRVLMARDEVNKLPKDQLSPRASVDALRKALADLPEELGKK